MRLRIGTCKSGLFAPRGTNNNDESQEIHRRAPDPQISICACHNVWRYCTIFIWFALNGSMCCIETQKPYCWWKKSQTTTWDVQNPVNNEIKLPYQLVSQISVCHQQYQLSSCLADMFFWGFKFDTWHVSLLTSGNSSIFVGKDFTGSSSTSVQAARTWLA